MTANRVTVSIRIDKDQLELADQIATELKKDPVNTIHGKITRASTLRLATIIGLDLLADKHNL